MSETPLDPKSLLVIDVAAEVRNISEAQLEGSWQIPIELVRDALGAGASRVEVTTGRRSLLVEDDGEPLDAMTLQRLGELMDDHSPPETRHQALVALEAQGELALIALAGARPNKLLIYSEGLLLEYARGQPTRLFAVKGGPQATQIELTGLSYDRELAIERLQSACRFAPRPIRLDGEPVPTGFTDVLAAAPLSPPFAGKLAIPRTGEGATVWLLLDGVLSTTVSIPSAPCFEAAVEMRRLVPEATRAEADLRSALAERVHPLVDQAMQAMLVAAASIHDFGPADQRRIRALVAACAKRGTRVQQARAVPVIPTVQGPHGEALWLCIDDVERAADAAELRVLPALLPSDDLSRFLLPETPVLLLGADERGPLAELLGIGLRPPPLRPGARGALARGREVAAAGWRGLARGAQQLLRLAPLPLADDALTASERAFLEALRRALPPDGDVPASVRMCEGRGPIRRLGKGPSWLLPRANRVVLACLRAWSEEPSWIYPAALAVLDGRDMPAPEARSAWAAR